MVSNKIINTHNPAQDVHYLFPSVVLELIHAKRVKLEYMSNCLCHWLSNGYYFPSLPPIGNIW